MRLDHSSAIACAAFLACAAAWSACDARTPLPDRVCPTDYDKIVGLDDNPGAIAVAGDDLFFTVVGHDTSPGGLGTAAGSGSVQRIARGGGKSTILAKDQAWAFAIAVDEEDVYWDTRTDHALRRVPRAGGPVVQLTDALGGPWGIAVDGEHVYVADAANGLVRISKSGGEPEPFGDLASLTPAGFPFAYAVATDATNAYVLSGASEGKRLFAVPKNGAPASVLATSDGGEDARFLIPTGAIALDSTHVYWTTFGAWGASGVGAVLRVAKAGGPVETIASGSYVDQYGNTFPMYPFTVAVSHGVAYAGGWNDGLIAMPAGGGAVRVLLEPGDYGPDGGLVAGDDGELYWSFGLPAPDELGEDFGIFSACTVR